MNIIFPYIFLLFYINFILNIVALKLIELVIIHFKITNGGWFIIFKL